jgi:hypothetical protein
MVEEYQKQRERQVNKVRSVTNFVMGTLFFLLGVFFLVYESLGITDLMGRKPSGLDKILGILFIIYGIWRVYRGYKNRF